MDLKRMRTEGMDEDGEYEDHVRMKMLGAYEPGVRVCTWVSQLAVEFLRASRFRESSKQRSPQWVCYDDVETIETQTFTQMYFSDGSYKCGLSALVTERPEFQSRCTWESSL